MDSTVIVALISFLGTFIGTAGGIIASSKLTQYRLEQLEKKVDIHTRATAKIPILEEKLSNITLRVKMIEDDNRNSHQFQ